MKKIKGIVMTLLTMAFVTLAMKTTAYADADTPPVVTNAKSLISIITIIIIACIFAVIVLKNQHNKK